jgi:hypothetical protein
MTGDPIFHPPHYNQGRIEAIDAIEASMSSEAFLGFCKGCAMKYIWRAGMKIPDKTAEDFRKAVWYLERAAVAVENMQKMKGAVR